MPVIGIWRNEVEEIQKIILCYVNTLSALSDGPLEHPAAIALPTDGYLPQHDLQICCASDGFPVMPAGPNDNSTQNIKELALLMCTYLNHHYHMW